MRNTHKLLIILILLWIPGQAQALANITDPIRFNLYNGAYIIINPQEVDYMTSYNATDSPGSSLEIGINGTQIIFKAFINKTVSNISYLGDNMTWSDSGALGQVNISAKMGEVTTNYTMNIDSIQSQDDISDTQGWTIFTYSEENEHLYQIFKSGAIFIPPTGNNKTIITFTDTTCLNMGAICNSEIVVFDGSTKLGAIKAKEEYTEIPRTANITLRLKSGTTNLLNNNNFFYDWFINAIHMWFPFLLWFALVIIIIILVMWNRGK